MATRSTHAARDSRNSTGRDGGYEPETGMLTSEYRGQLVPGTGSPWRWFFSGIWLAYLIQPVSELFNGHDAAWIAGGLVLTVAFCGLYLPVLMFSDSRPRLAGYGLVALAALAAVACLIYGKSWTPLWIYVSAAGGMVLTALFDRRRASVGIFAITALYLLFCRITHLDTATTLAVLLPVLLIGLAMIGFRLQISLMRELAQARGTVAKLAVGEERLRLARDMHDLTGQSLSMITLKSELAAKRLAKLSPSQERDAVLTELGDIGRVSRQTLHDIREAVSGYRLADARDRGHHGPERARGGRHRARRRRRTHPALGHVRPRRRGGAGLVPARGRHQRDPPLPRQALPHPPHRSRQAALPRGHRRRPRLRRPGSGQPGRQRAARHVRAAVRHRRPPVARAGRRTRIEGFGPRLPAHRHGHPGSRRHGRDRPGVPAMTQDEPVRLLLAEDQVMIREALAALLCFEGDIEVVAQVGRGDEVIEAARKTNPDVAVLDIEMPGMDGLAAAAELKRHNPDTKIVILTTFGRPGFLRRAMESGVSGFLVKDSPADKLTQTIRRVLAGERVIDPDLAAAALADGLNPLTPRERDVLVASADGRTIAEIAAQLYLSEGTVRNYLSACIQKTGARNRAEALRIASGRGWL